MILKWGQKNRKETWLKDKTFMASLKVSFLLFPFLDICSRYNFLLYCGFLLPDLCFCSNLIIFQVPTRISYWHYFPKLWVLINTNLSPEIDIWNVLWFLGGHTLVNVWFLTFLSTIPFVWKKIIHFVTPYFWCPLSKIRIWMLISCLP